MEISREWITSTDELKIELLHNGNWFELKEYNEMIAKEKENFINKEKISLLFDLLLMRIGQLFTFVGVFLLYYFVWFFCIESDVLYLIGWWMISGSIISVALTGMIGEAIKRYKQTTLRSIYRRAERKFTTVKEEEEDNDNEDN